MNAVTACARRTKQPDEDARRRGEACCYSIVVSGSAITLAGGAASGVAVGAVFFASVVRLRAVVLRPAARLLAAPVFRADAARLRLLATLLPAAARLRFADAFFALRFAISLTSFRRAPTFCAKRLAFANDELTTEPRCMTTHACDQTSSKATLDT
jgi:hypothetical protein